MGCSESKINSLETMNRCKERKTFMKHSVSARTAFVAAHFAYTTALKNVGAALSDYAQGELQFLDHRPQPPPPPLQHLPYGSPPPPSPPPPLPWDFFLTLMENVHGPSLPKVDDEGSKVEKVVIQGNVVENQTDHRGGRDDGYGVVVESREEPPPSFLNGNLLEVFTKLDDSFVKASKSAHEVSKTLDANKWYSNTNFANNLGDSNHSTRVVRVITWNKPFKAQKIANVSKEYFASKEKETHPTLLDMMLVWEKKLYDQVKASEIIKHEYQTKITLLNKLRKRGASSNTLERTQATVNRLHTRHIVGKQSIYSTVSEINCLRDEQLYPELVQLVTEMDIMWENMRKQHEKQAMIVQTLQNIKFLQSQSETNLENTKRIRIHVKIWCSEFEKLMLHQKEYIKSLNSWIKVCTMSINNNLRPPNPEIGSFLSTWQDELEKVPEEQVKTALNTFASVINTIVECQINQMKMKERCEETRRELTKRSRKFEEWCDRQMAKGTPSDEIDLDVMADQYVVVEELRRRLAVDEAAYQQHCAHVNDKTLMNLKSGLMEVFTTITGFARGCSDMYRSLKSHSKRGVQNHINTRSEILEPRTRHNS